MPVSKEILIKIGAEHPDLRDIIRPMLKEGSSAVVGQMTTHARDALEALENLYDQDGDDEDAIPTPEMFKSEAVLFIKALQIMTTKIEEKFEGTELENEIADNFDEIRDEIKKRLLK